MEQFFEKNPKNKFSKCNECKHFVDGEKCRAFDFIPDQILKNEVEHHSIWSTQKGKFVFEKK